MLSRLCVGLTKPSISTAVFYRGLTLSSFQPARQGFGSRFSQQTGFGLRQKAGPTLRERLLGPTTGKPFIYGTYAIAGASVFGIGMLCYYGLGLSKGGLNAMERSALWGEHVRQRLQSTYSYLAGSLALTAGAGMAAARVPALLAFMSNGGLLFYIGSLAAIIGTGMLVQSIPYQNTVPKHLTWAAHCAVLGAFLAPMCMLGGPAILRAAWYTAGLCAGLSATAICAPSERFLMMGGPLAMGLGVVFVANIGSFFFPPHTALGAGLASFVVYGGLILFSAFLLYDTQKVIKRAEMTPRDGTQTFYNEYGQPVQFRSQSFDPINAQLSLYMDILNIFIRMVMILGGGGNRRK